MTGSVADQIDGREFARTLLSHDIVDLSIALDECLPCAWPRHAGYQHSIFNWFEALERTPADAHDRLGAYYTATLHMDEHSGTHIDAPAHHIPPPQSGLPHATPAGDTTAEKVDLRQMVGPARVIDVRHLAGTTEPGISPLVSAEHLRKFEAEHGPVIDGDIVLLLTGWDSHIVPGAAGSAYAADPLQQRTPGWPAPSDDFLVALQQRGVRTLGTDAPSCGSTHDGAAAHYTGLGAGMVFIEAMGNLAALPPTGATAIFLGLKIVGGSGAPGRAIGLVPK
jgi:isatin hydrolase